jgi:hypothetical protein
MNGFTAQFADGSHTELAQDLNDLMDVSVMARWDYLLTWSTGAEIVTWSPLPVGAMAGNSTAPSTTMRTVR